MQIIVVRRSAQSTSTASSHHQPPALSRRPPMAATAVHLACFLSTLPVNPGALVYDEMWFQLLPEERFRPGCRDVSKLIHFELYTELGTPATNLTLGDVAALQASPFDRRRRTLLYLHGFGETPGGLSSITLRDALLARGSYNVLMANYVTLAAAPWYVTAVNNTSVVGRHVAHFVDFLADHGGLRMRRLHVVGISLGAQVAAVMGAATRSKVGRITGLDPAIPGYDWWPPQRRLNHAHARFVDVIHADTKVFGVHGSSGHADFYPNGGSSQPGCSHQELEELNATPVVKVFCNHLQAYFFFRATLHKDDIFPATPCESWDAFQRGECSSDDADVYMGIATPDTARGDFYLSTLGVNVSTTMIDSAPIVTAGDRPQRITQKKKNTINTKNAKKHKD